MFQITPHAAVFTLAALVFGAGSPAFAEHRGGGYVDALIQQLQVAYDDDDREDAAEELGKIGDPRALPALERAALYDPEDDVREDARKAIWRIHHARRVVIHREVVEVVRPAPVIRRTVRVYRRYYAPIRVAPAPVVVHTHSYVRW